MTDVLGNPDGLRAHRQASQRQTREDLELALARLRNGNPRRVKRGVLITASSVAEEAGVDRSTLYRYHEPVLVDIRKHNQVLPKQRLREKQGELAGAMAKVREYRSLLEAAQAEITAWARQNYTLSHRLQELADTVRNRDTEIARLHEQLRETRKISPFIALPMGRAPK
jgi:chromosome segregation ATPase